MSSRGPAIIVGHGSGIGTAAAEAFGRAGHPLLLISRDPDRLAASVKGLRSTGLEVHGIAADAGNPSELQRTLSEGASMYGAPEVLLYNAARWRPGPILGTTPSSFEDDFRVNVGGALVATQTVGPGMVTRGRGSLLFTGGGLAIHPSAAAPSLSVGKAGIRALALMLAEELAPRGVRVGTVTIMGTVAPNSLLAPERVADAFLRLHRGPPDPNTAEIVLQPP